MISEHQLHRLGEEAEEYMLKHSDRWIELGDYDYILELDWDHILRAAARVLLQTEELSAAEYEEIDSQLTDEPILKQHLHDALYELISEAEYEMQGECMVFNTPEDFLP